MLSTFKQIFALKQVAPPPERRGSGRSLWELVLPFKKEGKERVSGKRQNNPGHFITWDSLGNYDGIIKNVFRTFIHYCRTVFRFCLFGGLCFSSV
jgi:hypothetical protein